MLDRGTFYRDGVSLSACSAIEGSSEGTCKRVISRPDRVWGAINSRSSSWTMKSEENRDDGVIRATSEPAEDGTVIALAIDQVASTQSQFQRLRQTVFCREQGSTDPNLLKSAAEELVKALDGKLRG